MSLPVKFDHCVIHISDWDRSNPFYAQVLGAELIKRGERGWAYRFGDVQLNLHGPGVIAEPVARIPVAPGNSDLCFEWDGPIEDAIAHLGRCGVAIELGPVERNGAKGRGISVYFRDPDGSLLEFMSYRGAVAQPLHDPQVLPDDLPMPQDDGAADHLGGTALPDIALPATDGMPVNLAKLRGRTVVYVYPRTGRPGQALPTGWDAIPGARGCTPQSCGFRDHFAEMKRLGVAALYGLSTQDSAYQREVVERLHLPFAILSDAGLTLTRAMRLPTFAVDGMTLIRRMAWVIDDGIVTKVFYPVFPPDRSAADVVAWLDRHKH